MAGAFFTALVIFACLDDDHAFPRPAIYETNDLTTTQKNGLFIPSNETNPFDYAGQAYFNILDIYLNDNPAPSDIAEVKKRIGTLFATFFDSGLQQSPRQFTLPKLLDCPACEMDSALDSSSLSAAGRNGIKDFISEISQRESSEFSDIYFHILNFESSVFDNPNLTTEDKRVLLSITSIVRYAFYFSKGRDDQDWDVSVGNKAAVIGTLESLEYGVYLSVVTAVCVNLGITDYPPQLNLQK